MDELEFYDGAHTGQEIDDGVNAALNPETEAVDIYDSEAVEGNSTLVSVEGMAATMTASCARNRAFNMQSGNTITITNSGAANVFGILITAAGPSNYNGAYWLSGYGTADGTHFITNIAAATGVSVAKSSGSFVISHASGTNGFRVSVLVLIDDNNAVTVTFA